MEKRRMCPHCRAFISSSDRTCPYCNTDVGPRPYVRSAPADALGGLIPHARFVTMLLLLINTGLFVATLVYSARITGTPSLDLDPTTLYRFGAKAGRSMEWWRFITAGFLHGGVLHILMNSWVLFDLGAIVEETYGVSRYVVIYFISTITGFFASFYWSPVLSIGASAGIFGLLGAMIAIGVRDRSSIGASMRRFYVRWAIYGLLIGFLPFFAIDNAAHIGGLTGGFALGFIAGTPGNSRAMERLWQIAAGASIVITAAAFAEMFLGLISMRS